MTSSELLAGFYCVVMTGIVTYVFYMRCGPKPWSGEPRQRYRPLVAPTYLLWAMLTMLVMTLLFTPEGLGHFAAFCAVVFLISAIWYVLLLALLPLLRRWISSGACATLWLLPNFLYYSMILNRASMPGGLVLRLPRNIIMLTSMCAVWAAGCAGVLAWKIAGHLSFRRALLRDARDVTDPAVLEQWKTAQTEAGEMRPVYRLVTSPHTATPLSIGLLKRTIRVVLPEGVDYAPEELYLIFRHELIHIRREDSQMKLFLTLCTAVCWFNPLLWLAMRRCAGDLELSCDEQALTGADEGTRRHYADLILRAVGDGRGFTTCLSASADSLRYRLRNVVHPKKRLTGGIVVGVLLLALMFGGRHVAVAWGGTTGAEVLFGGQPEEGMFTVSSVSCGTTEPSRFTMRECADPEALIAYLAGLELCSVEGGVPDGDILLLLTYQGPDGTLDVRLTDRTLKLTPLHGKRLRSTTYYLDTPTDWNYVNSLLI